MRLDGKITIVTGGAMGNGKGIVKTFLENGATVIVIDYSNKLDEMLNEFSNYKNKLVAYKEDLRNKEGINKLIKEVYEKYNKIDVLVNNAGICELESFDKMSDELRDKHFDINIKGTWNITASVIPYMIEQKSGSIVNLSSVTGPMVADPGESAYATTKAAIIGFTKALSMEYANVGIRVNAIMPGYILTPMVEGMAKMSCPENPQSVIDGIAAGIPMKRLGTIEELGKLALFLGSDDSSYITGQGIVIDGGSTSPETTSVGV